MTSPLFHEMAVTVVLDTAKRRPWRCWITCSCGEQISVTGRDQAEVAADVEVRKDSHLREAYAALPSALAAAGVCA